MTYFTNFKVSAKQAILVSLASVHADFAKPASLGIIFPANIAFALRNCKIKSIFENDIHPLGNLGAVDAAMVSATFISALTN